MSENINENEKFELIKADAKDSGYSNPLLRFLLALGYLGIFGSMICICMVIMSALSKGTRETEIAFMAAALIAFAVCTAAVVVLNILDKRARKDFFEKKKSRRKNAKKLEGRIVGVEKNIRHVRYMTDVFDEVIWNFIVEYKNENNEKVTVKGDRFLNDISEVLRSDKVTVYVTENGLIEFGGYKLRNDPEDKAVKLKIKVYEEDSKV